MGANTDPDTDRTDPDHRHRPARAASGPHRLEAIPDGDGATVTFAPPPEGAGDRRVAWLTIDAGHVVDPRERR